jgi:hypothetical protein
MVTAEELPPLANVVLIKRMTVYQPKGSAKTTDGQ